MRSGGDEGVAMVMVIGISTVLLLLIAVAVTSSLGGLRQARTTQDWSAALGAAYAGVEEYQSRLANEVSYYQYGNPDSDFTPDTMALPAEVNPAFGVGAAGTWADVTGSDGVASYRYEVDNSEYLTTGTLTLRSTGRVGDETRSIVAELKQQGFIDFLYFTDYEIQDPLQSGANVSTCVKHVWENRPTTGCSEIAFGGNDVVRGPLHSNDAIRICAATFEGPVTTAYNPNSGVKYIAKDSTNANCTGQQFVLPAYPAYSPLIGMPATNSELKRETRSDLTTSGVPNPGCLFTGPTDIDFNADGTMTVRSPWSKATRTTGNPATGGSAPAACGVIGTAAGQLGSAGGATITVPADNVVYVQNVPNTASNPNYWASAARPSGLNCVGLSGSSGTGNGIGYPTTNELAPSSTASLPSYGCRNGDAFLQGTVDGHLTVGAENYVYVTGNIDYEDVEDDILGLVGNNAVWVWNPVTSGNSSILNNTNRNIDAAIISVAHTFQVQNYNRGGERGTLTVYGAIAQRFRGIVHGGNNGYYKDYNWDPRLQYTAPPKYLSPVTTTYGVNVWVEVAPVFDSVGDYR
jgi:hypothetical protein